MKHRPLRMEFEAGSLTKVNGFRPEYMSGHELIMLVRQMAEALDQINTIALENTGIFGEAYFKIRFLATTAAPEQALTPDATSDIIRESTKETPR